MQMKQVLIIVLVYGYGYSLKGERCYELKLGKRVERFSWMFFFMREKNFVFINF